MKLVKTFGVASALAAACAIGVAAQSATTERKEKTKVEVKGGDDVKVTGCLQRVAGGPGYVVTSESGAVKYAVVTDDDLTKYIDHRVEVKGNASDRGDAKVKIDRKVEGTAGEKSETKIETKGDMTELPFLGLKSIKTLKGSCQ
jgi:hypothetical protein